MAASLVLLGLLSLLGGGIPAVAVPAPSSRPAPGSGFPATHRPALAMTSPWWENYELKEQYLCPDRARIVLERNESQASLITGRYRSTLFRDTTDAAVVRYRNDVLRLTLRGDELTLVDPPRTFTCIRTEDA